MNCKITKAMFSLRSPLLNAAILTLFVTLIFCNCHFFSYAPYGGYFLIGIGLKALILHFLFWYSIIWLSGTNKFFAWSVLPFLLFTQMYCYQAEVTFGVASNELGVATLNTCWAEAKNYFNARSISLLAVGITAIVLICYLAGKIKTHQCPHRLLVTIIIILASAVACAAPRLAKSMRYETKSDDLWHLFLKGYQPAYSSWQFWKSIYDFLTPSKLEPVATAPSKDTFEIKPDMVILYIGEAMRADHSPLNGYSRNTTPGICANSNIINLPHVLSGATQTLPSIYSMLTKSEAPDGKVTHGSFIDILHKHHYKQHLLAGANTEGLWYQTPQIAALLHKSCPLFSRPASPEEYAADISRLLSNKGAPQFVLIEDGAGHMPYDSEHLTFGQACNMDKYDNCLLDIDARLTSIINTLQNYDALLIFTSDHGESFGEEGRYGHAGPMSAMEQRHVFSFIWYSDSYAARHPEIIQTLKENSTRFTSHACIYHTIISACGISSDAQVPSLDMTRTQPIKDE